MGDLGDDFNAMKEERRKERAKIEPERIQYARTKLKEAGFQVMDTGDPTKLEVAGRIDFWPYTGWWSGKGFGSGRGINNLIKELQKGSNGIL